MSYRVLELLLEDGSSPYEEWFLTLDPQAAAKVAVAKVRMELGNISNVKWFSGIGEYKIDWGPGYRIYLAKDGTRIIILLGGGTKKGNEEILNGLWRFGSHTRGINPERRCNMASTRDYKQTVVARVQKDPAFAQALLDEALTLFVNGEPDSAKLILRDLVNATVGFEQLAQVVHKPSKSLHRMLSVSGNPTMENLSKILLAIKESLHVEIRTSVVSVV